MQKTRMSDKCTCTCKECKERTRRAEMAERRQRCPFIAVTVERVSTDGKERYPILTARGTAYTIDDAPYSLRGLLYDSTDLTIKLHHANYKVEGE